MKYSALLVMISMFFLKVHAQQTMPDQNQYYFITLVQNNEVLENPGHQNPKYPKDLVSEAKLVTAPKKNGDPAQLWKLIKVGNDNNLYMIVNKKYNNYIDVPYSHKDDGETFFGHPNKGGENQQYYIYVMPGGTMFISSKVSGLILSMVRDNERHCLYRPEEQHGVWSQEGKCSAMVTANFVKQKGFTGSTNQQWKLVAGN